MKVVIPIAGWMIVAGSFAMFRFSPGFDTTNSRNNGLQDSAVVRREAASATRVQEAGAAAPGHSPDLTACADNNFSNVSFSLPLHGAAMATTGPEQGRTGGQAQCMQRLTITSTPCGATIYVDNIQAGRTPITFPMPPGRYTVVLLAPGHQRFARRILISNAPVEVTANLTPLP